MAKVEIVDEVTGEVVDQPELELAVNVLEAMKRHPRGKPLDEFGQEVPDPVPLAPPVGYKRRVPLAQQIREMVRSEALRMAAERAGAESFDEADDFDVGDDVDPRSPYEAEFEGLPVAELRARKRAADEAARKPASTVPPGIVPPAPDPVVAPGGAEKGASGSRPAGS